MAVTSLSPTRALRQPRRIDYRAVLGMFLMLAAVGGNVAFWVVSSDSRSVLVASRDLPAGSVLTPADLNVARMRMDDTLYAAAVPVGEREAVIGRSLASPAYAHQVLARAQVSSRSPLAASQLAITIPISADTAAGGQVRAGDSVQVLVTVSKGRPESSTMVVLPRAAVHDVGWNDRLSAVNTSGSGSFGPTGAASRRSPVGPPTSLTLLVTQDEALAVAQARWNGELDVLLLPPEQSPPSR